VERTDAAELAARIDHTVLGPTTTPDDVRAVLDEAGRHGMNACVPPCYVARAAESAPEVSLVTVVGFPHGQHDPEVKRREAERARDAGADELDVVLDVGRLLDGDLDAVRDEVERVVAAVPLPVKVTVEAPLPTEGATRDACALAREAGADTVKTTTSFVDGGATVSDVETTGEYLPVKASGGIDDYGAARAMLDAGAERIGASIGVAVSDGFHDRRPAN
jgi:deoxyribose-phosphate aldolase